MIEEPAPPLHRNDAPALKDYFQALQSSATLRTVLTALSMSTATAVTAALFFVFISHAKGLSTGDASALIFFYLVAALLGAPIWAHVATRFGKHNALIVATLAYIATQALIALAIPGTFWAMAIGTFVAGLPGAASGILVRAMIADVADEDRLRTGIDSTGMLFGLVTAMNKMGNALAVGIAFISLDLLKFQPEGGGTSPIALYCLYLGLPCLIAVIGIAMLWNYPLTAAKHAEIRRLLASRDRLGLDNAPIQSNAAPPNAPHVGIAGEAMSSGG
jgi:Na+/melibiose symporter-like transporter